MNSMKIGTYQMDTTFGLYLPEYTIPAPAVQTNFVKIIGRDGSVDLSNALGLHYDSRTWSLDFKCFDPTVNWHTLSSQVMNAIHGKRLNFEFDDDPNYFWTGRVSVQNYVSSHGTGTLKVTIVSDPFKYAKLSTIVTKTASTGTEYTGALVTFNTANAKINDLSVPISPIQDLHGYDHPWPAGGGVNLLPADYTESITVSKVFIFDTPLPAGQYTFSFISADTSSQVASYQLGRYRDETGSYVYTAVKPAQGFATFTNTEPCSKIVLYSNKAYNESAGFTTVFTGLMLKAGGTGSYSPYSNICPITGRTGLSVYRTGKNLLNQTNEKPSYYETDSDGAVTNTNGTFGWGYANSCFKSTLPAGDYTLIVIAKTANGASCNTQVCPSVGSRIVAANNSSLAAGGKVSANFTLSETTDIGVCFKNTGGYNWVMIVNRADSSLSTFEPYQGNTYAVDWTSEAGTVYGGTLDVVTGLLTVDREIYSPTGNEAAYTQLATSVAFALPTAYRVAGSTERLCSHFKVATAGTYCYVTTSMTVDELKTFFANNTVQICCGLATPLTYQLTAQEIEALVGTNNVWSDGGNVTVAVVTPETLTNNGRAVVPTLTASADMVLKWENYSASVQQGTSTIPQLILENGANLIYIIGTGSISFTWQEVRL